MFLNRKTKSTNEYKMLITEKIGNMLYNSLKDANKDKKEKNDGKKLSNSEIKMILVNICEKMNNNSYDKNDKNEETNEEDFIKEINKFKEEVDKECIKRK